MDPESDSDEDLSEEACGECLFDLLVDLKLRGVLFATDVCKLSYWAAMSGAKGPVKKLAKEPGDPSAGHYSDHFDRVVGLAAPDPRIYKLDVPVFSKVDGCRMLKPLSFLPPHVVLSNEVSSGSDDFGAKLAGFVEHLPPTYANHPVVQSAAPRVAVPLAQYIDGIGYSKQNSILGFFLVNMFTSSHHLLCTIRKIVFANAAARAGVLSGPFSLPCIGAIWHSGGVSIRRRGMMGEFLKRARCIIETLLGRHARLAHAFI